MHLKALATGAMLPIAPVDPVAIAPVDSVAIVPIAVNPVATVIDFLIPIN